MSSVLTKTLASISVGETSTAKLSLAAGGMPIVGYSVYWTIRNPRISHVGLQYLLGQAKLESGASADFGKFVPLETTDQEAFKRAILEWVSKKTNRDQVAGLSGARVGGGGYGGYDYATAGVKESQQVVLTKINNPEKDWLVFLLSVVSKDLEEYGITQGTRIRVYMNKKTLYIRATYTQSGALPENGDGEEEGDQILPTVSREVRALFLECKARHNGQDLGRMLVGMVKSARGLNSAPIRGEGGIYLVLSNHTEQLVALCNVVANLGGGSYVIAAPIIDCDAAKHQYKYAVFDGLKAELDAKQNELVDMEKRSRKHKVTSKAVTTLTVEYKALKQKAELFGLMLDVQTKEVSTRLDRMIAQAQSYVTNVLLGDNVVEYEEEYDAGDDDTTNDSGEDDDTTDVDGGEDA